MYKKNNPSNLDTILSQTSEFNLSLESILNSLPFGISVQDKERVILFENEKAKLLTGSFRNKKCYLRWRYLPEEGKSICKDCPATISLIDFSPHKVFRRTLNQKYEEIFIEINVIPILEKDGSVNKYIEILHDVTKDEIARTLTNRPVLDIISNLEFSFSKYGPTAGEVFLHDVSFLDKPDEYIQKLTMFTYIGIFQNKFDREGLFGPLPVLDFPYKSMIAYSFRTTSPDIKDPRRAGMEPCLLFIYFDRENYFLFERRNEILTYLNDKLEKTSLEHLTENWFELFKEEFRIFLLSLFNEFKILSNER